MLARIIHKEILPALIIAAALLLGLLIWQIWLVLAIVISAAAGYSIYRLKLFNQAYFLLAFALPLSVEMPLFKGVNMLFPSEPLAVSILIALGINALQTNAFKKTTKLLIPSFALISALAFTTLLSTNVGVSVKYTLIYSLYIVCFYWGIYAVYNKSKLWLNSIMSGYTFSYLLVIAWAVYKWSWYAFNPVVVPAIFEPFYADHTIFSAAGVFLSIYWLGCMIKAKDFKKRLLNLMILIAVLVGLRIANSRAALLSLPVGLIVGYFVYRGFSKRHLAIVAFSTICVLLYSKNSIYEWISYNQYDSRDEHASFVERTASVGNVQTDVSNLERINRWAAALNMGSRKPLYGFGPGTFQFEYIPFQDERWMNRLSVVDIHDIPQNSGGTVHSEPLLFLSESGIVGLLSWILLIITWLWWVLSVKKGKRSIYLAIATAMVSTYLFHGFFNNFLNTDKLAFLFWGAAAVMMIEVKNENPNKYILQLGR
ncbi:MAG: O-antigen ligase family protein [Bacteroidia bacterium]